ncbi:MAG: lysylphosphatidylglycerol synthase transmembrane domain-containing protein [Longimicrobiales bacterium]|nr:lysylphosphatidylglycerol synthase transmembrane domain-containing protein [Longimicrobiales bacterium]
MSSDGASPSRRAFFDWKAVLGVLISVGLLWFAFRDVHLAEVWDRVRRADLALLALAGALATLPFPLRAIRWKPLLEPAYDDPRFRPRFAATCIGFMANNLLPARVGEFARAWALSRLEPVRVSASFGSLVVERMFDGIVIVLFLLGALAWPTFPDVSGRDFTSVARWAGVAFAGVFAVLLLMVSRPERSVRWFEGSVARMLPGAVRRPVVDALEAFLEGVAAVREWRLVLRAFAWSLVIWLVASLSVWVGMLAFGIELPFVAAVFLQSVISLAVALPSAPGFFGVFEAAARVGLVEIWGTAAGPAVAFAIGYHLAGFVPVTVIGLYYVWRLGFSWRDVGRSEDAVETAVEARAADGRRRGAEETGGQVDR